MPYTVTYHETEHTPLIDLPAIRALPTIGVSLDDITDACEAYHLEATVQPEVTQRIYTTTDPLDALRAWRRDETRAIYTNGEACTVGPLEALEAAAQQYTLWHEQPCRIISPEEIEANL